MSELDKASGDLVGWTECLLATVEGLLPQVRAALDPSAGVPPGFPSRAALAELILDEVGKRLRDVERAAEAVRAAVRAHDPA